jgi:hypothetical protein
MRWTLWGESLGVMKLPDPTHDSDLIIKNRAMRQAIADPDRSRVIAPATAG